MDSSLSTNVRDHLRDERRRLIAEAGHARVAGNDRKAVALYKKILLEEPRNVDVALKAAPLLARRGEAFDAWQLFRMASQELLRTRRREECLDALREACRWVPHEFDAWRLRAELELKLGREERAYETLLEGRQCFTRPDTRAQAIALLSRAREIEPFDGEVILDLAKLHAKTDQPDAALELLDTLATMAEPGELRRAYWLRFRTTLAPSDLWKLVSAWMAPNATRRSAAKAQQQTVDDDEILDHHLEPPTVHAEPVHAEPVQAEVCADARMADPTMPLVQWDPDDRDPRAWPN